MIFPFILLNATMSLTLRRSLYPRCFKVRLSPTLVS